MKRSILVLLIVSVILGIYFWSSKKDGEYVRIKYESYLFQKEFRQSKPLNPSDWELIIRRVEAEQPGRWVVSNHPSRVVETKNKYKSGPGIFPAIFGSRVHFFITNTGEIGRE